MKLKKILSKTKKTKLRNAIAIVTGIAIVMGGVLTFVLHPKNAEAAWFDDNFAYRQKISFTHNAALTDRRITITVDTATLITNSKMQSDCDDSRFTDINGLELKYQLTGTCNNASTTYDVIFPTIINGANVGYFYYGNAQAYSKSQNVSSFTSLTPSGSPSLASEEKGALPVVFWGFNDSQGTTAQDSSTQNNDGTLTNSPTWKVDGDCIAGSCLLFNGSNTRVGKTYSSDSELNPGTGSITVSTWFRHPTTISSTRVLLSRADGLNGVGYKVYMNSSGNICFGIDAVAGSFPSDSACSTATYNDNQWHFVSGVKNTTSDITLYINGKQSAQDASITTSSISGTNTPLYVGIDADTTSNAWSGFIDEVKVFNYAKSSAQIYADYTSRGASDQISASTGSTNALPVVSNGLMAYWNLDESSGNATDTSGNNITLANSNTTPFSTGKFGKAASFTPASSQYLSGGAGGTATYNIDAHTSVTDTGDHWSSDALAFDAITGVGAVALLPSTLIGVGTNAPSSGSAITQVTARVFGLNDDSGQVTFGSDIKYSGVILGSVTNTDAGGGWSSTVTLTTPSGGWTWPKVQELEAHHACSGNTPGVSCEAHATEISVTTSGGSIGGIKSASFWAYPDSNTNYYIDFNGTQYIQSTSGTLSATGITNPKIYVNGEEATTIVASKWQLITVTTDTEITSSTIGLGKIASNYYDGSLDEVRLYNKALTQTEVRALYNYAPGPAAYWKLDEKTGTTAVDSSGNSNTSSTFTGNTAWIAGKYGSAVEFDGANDTIQITESTSTDIGTTTDSYTVSAWIKTTTDGAGTAAIIAKNDGSGAYPFSIHLNSSEQACLQISDGTNSPSVCGATALNDGLWHYVSGTRDVLEDAINVYVDGVVVNTTTDTTTATSANNDNLSIGNSGTSYLANDFTGSTDELMIYNYARSTKQIIEDYNAGHPLIGTPVAGAVGHWKMDDLNGITAQDTTPNNNDLTLSSASWTTSGKMGGGWNGTGSVWLSRADDSDFDFAAANDLTISTWFKSDSVSNPANTEYLITKGTITNTGTAGYALYANTAGNIVFGVKDDAAWGASSPDTITPDDTVTSSTDIYDNTWHHIVAVKTGTSRLDLYIDGKASGTPDTSIAATATLANAIALRVADDDEDSANSFNGDLDEVKIYRAALSSSDALTEYNQGKASVFGALSTGSDGTTPSNGTDRSYCIPRDTSTCNAPVAEWKLDENTGTAALDTSGNGNSGSFTNSPMWGIGKKGAAVTTNGSTSYISINDNALLDFTAASNFTVQAWVKHNGAIATNPDYIITKADTTNGGYKIYMDATGNLCFAIDDDASWTPDDSACTSGTDYADSTWYHVVGTKTGTTKIDIYINGVFKQTDASIAATGTLANTNGFFIGMDRDGTSNGWDGSIDHAQVYDYARTAAQIAWDYNRGGPIGWWKMNECQGTTLNDASGNGYTGTLTIGAASTYTSAGSCNSGTSTHSWNGGSTGKYTSALATDGTDDYAQISDTANLRFDSATQDFSLFAWVKRTTTGTEYIISKEDAADDGWLITFNSSNQVVCSEDATDITSTTTITDTNWHNIGCTISRAGNGQVYIDGKADGTAIAMGSDAMATTSNIRIGTRSYTSANYFNGLIDDIRIYNYALTTEQIKTVINEGSALRFGPLTGSP